MKKRHRRPYYLRLFLILIVSVTFALVLVITYSVNNFTQSMLHPKRLPVSGELLATQGIPYQKIKITTSDGLQLAAWYTAPENGALILLAHGYGDNRPENLYAMLAGHGYGVLAWDFRAHGESGGDISTLGYFEQLDVEAALDYALTQAGVEHIGAWGGSMGGATMILTAAKRTEIEAVITDGAFPALEDVLRGSLPYDFLFPMMAAFSEYRSGADIESVNPIHEIGKIGPRAVFLIDGWAGDKETSSAYRLYTAANEPREIWVKEDIPHMGMWAAYPKKYENNVIGFFDQWLLGK